MKRAEYTVKQTETGKYYITLESKNLDGSVRSLPITDDIPTRKLAAHMIGVINDEINRFARMNKLNG